MLEIENVIDNWRDYCMENKRIYFLDNLRFTVVIMVVFHHAMLPFVSGTGAWWIIPQQMISGIYGQIIGVTDLFIMPALFFIAGYFVPLTLEKYGAKKFCWNKFKRLYVPWLIAMVTLSPLYMILFYANRVSSEAMPYLVGMYYWRSYVYFINKISVAHLWFLPLLFYFCLFYLPLAKIGKGKLLKLSPVILVTIFCVVSILFMFLIGITVENGFAYWIKTIFIEVQISRLATYFLLFLLGSIMYRKEYFEKKKLNWWKSLIIAGCATQSLGLLYLVKGNALLSAGIYALCYNVASFAIVFFLLAIFQRFFDSSNKLSSELSRNSYGVYLLHVVVMGGVHLLIRFVMPNPYVQSITLFLATVIICNSTMSMMKRLI